MKFGVRKPSVKKSIKARTTGKAKRAVKKALIPGYGKKGTGWIKDPKKAAYNKIYNKTTISIGDLLSNSKSTKKPVKKISSKANSDSKYNKESLSVHAPSELSISMQNDGNLRSNNRRKKKSGCLIPILIFLGVCAIIGSFSSSDDSKNTDKTVLKLLKQ